MISAELKLTIMCIHKAAFSCFISLSIPFTVPKNEAIENLDNISGH